MNENKLKLILKILNISFMTLLVLTVAVMSVLLYNAYNGKFLPNGGAAQTVLQPEVETIVRYAREPFNLTEYTEMFNDDLDKKVVFWDTTFGEVAVPLLTNVPLNPLNNENYKIAPSGLKYYVEDDKIKTLAGIDVSEHNGVIDWAKVKKAGIDFAMVRVGYRGYETGKVNYDKRFKENIEGATQAGIQVGVYFFSQALTVDEAVEESNKVLDAIEYLDVTFPVVYDWEIIYDDDARSDDAKFEDFTDCAVAFCENVKNNGYVPMIYSTRKQCYLKYDMSRLKDYPLWMCDYNEENTYYYNYNMWQYSCTGTVDGVSGDVDLNLSFVDYSNEIKDTVPVSAVFPEGIEVAVTGGATSSTSAATTTPEVTTSAAATTTTTSATSARP